MTSLTVAEILQELSPEDCDAAFYGGTKEHDDDSGRIEYHGGHSATITRSRVDGSTVYSFTLSRLCGGTHAVVASGTTSRVDYLLGLLRIHNENCDPEFRTTIYSSRTDAIAQVIEQSLENCDESVDDYDVDAIADDVLVYLTPTTADGVGLANHTGFIFHADEDDFWAAVQRHAK